MWNIRPATTDDVPGVKAIAYQYRDELGFVNRAALQEAIKRGELHVCDTGGLIAGFVNWHARRDGWRTIYEVAVHRDYAGRGIGRALLRTVPTPTRLKCTTDNDRANRFYEHAGMTLARTEQGRKRMLNVWERETAYPADD